MTNIPFGVSLGIPYGATMERTEKDSLLSKTDMVYRALQEEIVEGRIPPGERLVERNLMERFGVSKTPIREALLKLKQDGLVEGGVVHQGVSVIRISREDAIEIYDLREVLEGLAARKAAERIREEDIEKLNSFLQLFEECVEKGDIRKYAKMDLDFHKFLAVVSGNKRLVKAIERFFYQARILLRTSLMLPSRGPKVSLAEHRKVVEAIIEKNASLAEKKAKEHVRNTKEAVLRWFENTQW